MKQPRQSDSGFILLLVAIAAVLILVVLVLMHAYNVRRTLSGAASIAQVLV